MRIVPALPRARSLLSGEKVASRGGLFPFSRTCGSGPRAQTTYPSRAISRAFKPSGASEACTQSFPGKVKATRRASRSPGVIPATRR